MKKYILIACAVLMSFASQAQSSNMGIGVKVGYNSSSMKNSGDIITTSGKSGISFGLMGLIPISGNLAFQPEVLYSQQGAEQEYSSGGFSYKGTMSMDYINVPLMLTYTVFKGVAIQAGPQIGFLMSAKNDYEDNYLGYQDGDELDIKDLSNDLDIGLNLGLGYTFMEKYYVDARYNMSFSELFPDQEGLGFEQADFKNRVFQISVGYRFK